MSKRTDKIAAKARLAAENAEKEAKVHAAKLKAAEAADAEAALSSPADKAMERAFSRGTLPDEDRRAPAAVEPAVELPPVRPPGSVDEPVESPRAAPDLEALSAVVDDARRPQFAAPSAAVAAVRDALTFEGTPIPAPVAVAVDMVKTPDALVPLDEVSPSTIEAAVAFQRIPNDRISHVHERADGQKVDALGHIFEKPPVLPK